jgi:hypothetical protein
VAIVAGVLAKGWVLPRASDYWKFPKLRHCQRREPLRLPPEKMGYSIQKYNYPAPKAASGEDSASSLGSKFSKPR